MEFLESCYASAAQAPGQLGGAALANPLGGGELVKLLELTALLCKVCTADVLKGSDRRSRQDLESWCCFLQTPFLFSSGKGPDRGPDPGHPRGPVPQLCSRLLAHLCPAAECTASSLAHEGTWPAQFLNRSSSGRLRSANRRHRRLQQDCSAVCAWEWGGVLADERRQGPAFSPASLSIQPASQQSRRPCHYVGEAHMPYGRGIVSGC